MKRSISDLDLQDFSTKSYRVKRTFSQEHTSHMVMKENKTCHRVESLNPTAWPQSQEIFHQESIITIPKSKY